MCFLFEQININKRYFSLEFDWTMEYLPILVHVRFWQDLNNSINKCQYRKF